MLLNVILGLVALALAVYAFILRQQRDALRNAPKPKPLPSTVTEVLKRNGRGDWVHHGWVRAGSKAEQTALDLPGHAIRRSDSEEIQLGVQ